MPDDETIQFQSFFLFTHLAPSLCLVINYPSAAFFISGRENAVDHIRRAVAVRESQPLVVPFDLGTAGQNPFAESRPPPDFSEFSVLRQSASYAR